MQLSPFYIEMLFSGAARTGSEGRRSYPAASLEIMLMDYARHRAANKEIDTFRQLCSIFDWQLTRRQQNTYIRQLKQGQTLVLTDLSKVILWTSQNFMRMTGYRPADALGHTPSLLQGPDTDSRTTQHIREQLSRAKPVRADLTNYRKDGSTYTCRIAINPLRNTQGELTHFLAVEQEVISE